MIERFCMGGIDSVLRGNAPSHAVTEFHRTILLVQDPWIPSESKLPELIIKDGADSG